MNADDDFTGHRLPPFPVDPGTLDLMWIALHPDPEVHNRTSLSDFLDLMARRQFPAQLVEEGLNFVASEPDVHARWSAPRVMNTPRRRKDEGDSTSARGCIPGRSETNHHGSASREGSQAHWGTVQPSRRARCSAIAASAASKRRSPVGGGSSCHITAATATPA